MLLREEEEETAAAASRPQPPTRAAGAGSRSAVAAGSSRTGGRLAQKRHGQGDEFFRSRHCSNAGQIHAIQSTSASLYRPSSDPQALAPARSPDHRHWFSPDPNQDLKLLGEEGGHAYATRVCGAPTHPNLFCACSTRAARVFTWAPAPFAWVANTRF